MTNEAAGFIPGDDLTELFDYHIGVSPPLDNLRGLVYSQNELALSI